ncbi:MAG: DUF302 domain-containing protein [Acidobacteriales bacterium]|nr:DUF302 domain-containing protein [Terriglobales bacterium]
MASAPDNGIVHVNSPCSVPEKRKRIETIVQGRGLAILARTDRGGDAAKVGLIMHPTELLIFGDPKAGTPLMVASRTLAIDLPLKTLVWKDGSEKVWVSFSSPEYLKQRHRIPEVLLNNISGFSLIVEEAVR